MHEFTKECYALPLPQKKKKTLFGKYILLSCINSDSCNPQNTFFPDLIIATKDEIKQTRRIIKINIDPKQMTAR